MILALKNHIPIQQQQVLLLNYAEIPGVGYLAFFKADDVQYFAKILKEDEMELSVEEMKERKSFVLPNHR